VVIGEGGERHQTSFASALPWALKVVETKNELKEAMKEVEEPVRGVLCGGYTERAEKEGGLDGEGGDARSRGIGHGSHERQAVVVMRTLLWICRGAATVPNWEGILQELGEPDLLLLLETHVLPDADLPWILGYDVVTNLPRAERFRERQSLGSGGIAVLVKFDSALAQKHGQLGRVSEHGTHLWLRFQQTGIRMGRPYSCVLLTCLREVRCFGRGVFLR
jgi:hypothetical protein